MHRNKSRVTIEKNPGLAGIFFVVQTALRS